MGAFFKLAVYLLILFVSKSVMAQDTERFYLSGKDKDHQVDWDFFCTEGRNSGEWTTIPVPSNWELEGFGTYNFGLDKKRGEESGLYRYRFSVPKNWKSKIINIVFEGSMTDTEVKINGKLAGEKHQGAFYRFKYNITNLVNYGKENLLEVKVDKQSSNESVNEAERKCDFWIFGGIFRPVYLEVMPEEHIERIALNALSDGKIKIIAKLNEIKKGRFLQAQISSPNGETVGEPFFVKLRKDYDTCSLEKKFAGIKTWSPESPNLYMLTLQLKEENKVIHQVTQRFGFRTVEIKERDGIYINGIRIKFKGICRHSFWPSSGRTTSKQISIDDVNLMKDMNMNAVRMSHYPPDPHFLDVCDSLGLFVLDELAGWHTAYDTEVGTKLVHEMINRDVNHPSIVVWDNGNEGGWNEELDHWFDELDPQKRPLIHPYQVFRKTDTDHYQEYNAGTNRHQNGNKIVFPTEFLHGLYDGGMGAGLEDYWNQMWNNPISAGGFLWDFSDEAVVRVDQEGKLDSDGNHGPDGILGPYREKEGSFYTVKELWSPVFFKKRFITPEFDGKFYIQNRYHYTNLKDCKFKYCFTTFAKIGEKEETVVNFSSEIIPPALEPGDFGILKINLPEHWKESDALYITATDPYGREIYTWSWPIKLPEQVAQKVVPQEHYGKVKVNESERFLTLVSEKDISVSWDKTTGLLSAVENGKGSISFNNGPVFIGGEVSFNSISHKIINQKEHVVETHYSGQMNLVRWTFYPDGWLKLEVKYTPDDKTDLLGISFSYPENLVNGMKWLGYGPYRVWKNRMKGNTLDVWEKEYNNTITGESEFIYPEFKGYHKGLYWITIQSEEQDFSIITGTEDLFLQMYKPEPPEGKSYDRAIAPHFPKGDISFMHSIPPIGSKFFEAPQLGPMGQRNNFSNRGNGYTKEVVLYFDFSEDK